MSTFVALTLHTAMIGHMSGSNFKAFCYTCQIVHYQGYNSVFEMTSHSTTLGIIFENTTTERQWQANNTRKAKTKTKRIKTHH